MKIFAKRVANKWEEKEIEIRMSALVYLWDEDHTLTPTEYDLRGELTNWSDASEGPRTRDDTDYSFRVARVAKAVTELVCSLNQKIYSRLIIRDYLSQCKSSEDWRCLDIDRLKLWLIARKSTGNIHNLEQIYLRPQNLL